MSINKTAVAAFFALLLAGCVSSQAPRQRLPEVEEMPLDGYGAWVQINYAVISGDSTAGFSAVMNVRAEGEASSRKISHVIEGEFIASTRDSVCVLTDDGFFTGVAHNRIQNVILELYRKMTPFYAGWSIFGTASAFTHGFFMLFTVPMWLTAGIITTAGESRRDRWDEKQPSSLWWLSMQKFARFPQGLPPGLDVNALLPKIPPASKSLKN